MNKNPILLILFSILISSSALAIELNNFNNSLTVENMTFSTDQDITRYLEVPFYIDIYSLTLNLTGFNSTTTQTQELNFYDEYTCNFGGACTNGYDNNTDSNGFYDPCGSGNQYSYENYTVPDSLNRSQAQLYDSRWNLGFAQGEIPTSCYSTSNFQARLYWWCNGASRVLRADCYNGAGWSEIFNENELGANVFNMYYSRVAWYSNALKNTSLDIGNDGTNEWSDTSYFFNESTGITSITSISSVLNNTCNCTGCYLSSGSCKIPFVFHSDNAGVLQYSNLSFNYNVTNINITILDENTDSIITETVYFEFYGNNNNYNFSTSTGNLNVFLESDNYTVIFYSNDYPTRSRKISHQGLVNSNYNFYLANYSTSSTITFKVIDQFGNPVETANIIVEKRFIDDDFKTLIELTTNVNGEASTSVETQTTLYRFLVEYDGVNVWNNSDPNGEIITTTDQTYSFYVYIGTNYNQFNYIFENLVGVFDDEYTSGVGNISYAFSAPSSSTVCLYLFDINFSSVVELSNNCTTGTLETLKLNFSGANITIYAESYLLYDGYYFFIDSYVNKFNYSETPPYSTPKNKDSLFIVFLAISTIAIVFRKRPPLMILSIVIVFDLFVYAGFIYLETYAKKISVISIITILGVIIAWVVRKNE